MEAFLRNMKMPTGDLVSGVLGGGLSGAIVCAISDCTNAFPPGRILLGRLMLGAVRKGSKVTLRVWGRVNGSGSHQGFRVASRNQGRIKG